MNHGKGACSRIIRTANYKRQVGTGKGTLLGCVLPPNFSFYFSILNRIYLLLDCSLSCETPCRLFAVRLEERQKRHTTCKFLGMSRLCGRK